MLQTLKNKSKRIASTLVAGVVLFSQLAVVPSVGATSTGVTICHATGSSNNPYNKITVDENAVNGNGNDDHNRSGHQNGEDIIPPGPWDSNGRNWHGQNIEIWNNDCETTTKLEVKKVLAPTNDTGKFNLSINVHDGGYGDTTKNNVGNNGSTGKVSIQYGKDVTVSESAGSGTSLNDYNAQIVCTDQNGAGAPTVIASDTGTSLSIDKDDIKKGDDIQCVITNTRKPKTYVEVIKHLGPVTDSGKFELYVNGSKKKDNATHESTTNKVEISDTSDLTVGEKAESGTSLSNYTTAIECKVGDTVIAKNSNVSTNQSGSRSLTIDKSKIDGGDNIVCIITNSNKHKGSLIVKKDVINNNGNTKKYSDFTFANNGSPLTLVADATDGQGLDGINDTSFANLAAGTSFNIIEADASAMGYTTTYSGDCTGTIAAGVTKVCTITNNDVDPTLTLKKVVVNDNGGTAPASNWLLNAQMVGSDTALIDSIAPNQNVANTENGNSATTIAYEAAPGSYVLSESGDTTNYTPGTWTCEGGSLTGNVVTLTWGDNVVCTIVNDDKAPVLTLQKQVYTQTWGGNATPADWLLKAILNGNAQPSVSGYGYAESDNTLKAGTYTLGENGPFGYEASSWQCNGQTVAGGVINISVGQSLNCVILNSSKPAKITVEKKVINDDGGDAKARDFDLWVGHEKVKSGEQELFRGDTWYKIDEKGGPKGYEQVSKECWDVTFGWHNKEKQNLYYGKLYAKVGHKYYCKIVNDDIAPKLTIKKDATPNSIQPFTFTLEKKHWNNWFTKETFQLNDNGTPYPLDNDKTFTLKAGTYRVTESETDGWYLDDIKCWGAHGEYVNLEKGRVTVNLKVGDNVTCKFENTQYGKIWGVKFEDVNKNRAYDWNWGEGSPEPLLSDWTITLEKLTGEPYSATTTTNEYGVYAFENLKPGKYKVCEEQQEGWVQTYPADKNGCHFIWIAPGETKHDVKFGNFKLGQVTGVKFNDINGNGVRDEDEPTLKNWEITLTKKCVVKAPVQFDVRTLLDASEGPDCEEETLTTKTDENGAYSFTGLDKGTYVICEVQQANWTQTAPNTKDGCIEFAIEASGHKEVVDFGNKAKPQILDAATTVDPQELVKTGASAAISTGFGLVILSILGVLHFLARRKSYQS